MKIMIDTKIYNDSWFYNLPAEAKLLFLFLIGNDSCNLIGCYELPKHIITTYTKIPEDKLDKLFELLFPKAGYANGWVFIKSYGRYNPMRNPSIEQAQQKQYESLPEEIKETFELIRKGPEQIAREIEQGVDRVYTGYKEEVKEKEQVKEDNKTIWSTEEKDRIHHRVEEIRKKFNL